MSETTYQAIRRTQADLRAAVDRLVVSLSSASATPPTMDAHAHAVEAIAAALQAEVSAGYAISNGIDDDEPVAPLP